MKNIQLRASEDKGLSHWVTITLQEAILDGQFEPGEKLDQDLIATQLQVSRTPVREALKVLATEGYVEIQPYRGAYIPRISQQDINHVYEMRWVIEPEVVRQATPKIPDDLLSSFEHLFNQLSTSPTAFHEKRVLAIDQDFHGCFANYCLNSLFSEILGKLNHRIVQVRSFAFRQPGKHLETSMDEHIAILKAVQARDAELAASLMKSHLKNSAYRICQSISQ